MGVRWPGNPRTRGIGRRGIVDVIYFKSGSHFVSGGEERLLKLWDYDEGVCKCIGVGHSGTITCCAISPDQSFIVSTGTEGAILIWTVPDEVQDKCHESPE